RSKKIELIRWISEEKNIKTIQKVDQIRNQSKALKKEKRKFGSGKGFIRYMADDFDAPLDAFNEYLK
ncbi:MAG: DUF2281 domain-containing protein, partial [Bacteroidales bacterium]|nr:DUF2281 domain-containing protein [Bacteroidales bacterium]